MRDLLLTALRNPAGDEQPSMSSLLEILREIADRTNSYGCILWQVIPPEGASGGDPKLFVLADWTTDGRHCANHDMSIETSRTGRAVTRNRQFLVSDVKKTIKNPDRFLSEANIKTFVTTPVVFQDRRLGALNCYRQIGKYDKETRNVASEHASLLPLLYAVLRTQVSSALLQKVTEITRSFDPHVPEGSTPHDRVKSSVADICQAVAKAFNCLEVSVFLEDPMRAAGLFELVATTDDTLARVRVYEAGESHGVTGWTLVHSDVKVRIFDLPNAKVIASIYPGMEWKDSWSIAETVKDRRVPPGAPLSFMAAPILRSGQVAGVIRCSVGMGPWYFAPDDHSILEMVASHLGSLWGTILDRREVDNETKALKKLVEQMVLLNDAADTEITKSHVHEKSILQEALQITRNVIPGATITAFRLLNEQRTALEFPDSDRGAPENVSVPQSVYPLSLAQPGSAGATVLTVGEVCEIEEVARDPYYAKHYPGAKRMMIAPIQLRDSSGSREFYGVLDVCSTSAQAFPVFARDSATLLSSQLALYKKLGETVRTLNDANQVHVRLTEDMAHQLTSPLLIAKGRVQESLKASNDAAMTDRLLEVRGAIGRALHVCLNLDVFVRLERGREVPVVLEDMTGSDLIATLVNTSNDASRLRDTFLVYGNRPVRSLWDGSFTPRRRLVHSRFEVKREGFEKINKIRTDRRLLEQVLTQVLDNAFKYSYVGSTVEIEGGYTAATRKRDIIERQRSRTQSLVAAPDMEEKRRRIRISVINEGIDLSAEEAELVTERGVQAEDAKRYSQGGSGIGLWIVRELMRILGGELDIRPTDGQHRTEITLLFPVD